LTAYSAAPQLVLHWAFKRRKLKELTFVIDESQFFSKLPNMKNELAKQGAPIGESLSEESPGPRRVPLTMVQKTVAKRMVLSANEIPQFSISRELDADQLAERRARINVEIGEENGRVSVTALLIWLTARALLEHPRMNSQFDEDAAIQHESVNMAVAMDAPYGLVAPVIHGAETLSVAETAAALKDLGARAMEKRLSMNDFADATFTTSNLGMFGVSGFIPMVNPPQGAIMGVAAPRTAVKVDDEGQLVPARAIELTVTADHRILDGAEVARFLQTLAESVGK
jgi:pyruvate dehydrogenase E2 component (dihydrolipoamide acetyltransferase)